jgi:hypothetical protein
MADDKTNSQPTVKPGLGSLVKSILAAAIGVQTDKNREKDFTQGSPLANSPASFIK